MYEFASATVNGEVFVFGGFQTGISSSYKSTHSRTFIDAIKPESGAYLIMKCQTGDFLSEQFHQVKFHCTV